MKKVTKAEVIKQLEIIGEQLNKPMTLKEADKQAFHRSVFSLPERFNAIFDDRDFFEMPDFEDESNSIEVSEDGRVALIKFEGRVLDGIAPWLEEWLGAVNPTRFARDVDRVTNAGVDNVFFLINSFGGTVIGTQGAFEAVNRLVESGANVAGHAVNMCSAAAWTGAPIPFISGQQTGMYASYGVIGGLIDDSKYWEELGIQFNWIRSGDRKAKGQQGEPITEEVIKEHQAEVDSLFSIFWRDVTSVRTSLSSFLQDGRSVLGAEAVSTQVLDAIEPMQATFNRLLEG